MQKITTDAPWVNWVYVQWKCLFNQIQLTCRAHSPFVIHFQNRDTKKVQEKQSQPMCCLQWNIYDFIFQMRRNRRWFMAQSHCLKHTWIDTRILTQITAKSDKSFCDLFFCVRDRKLIFRLSHSIEYLRSATWHKVASQMPFSTLENNSKFFSHCDNRIEWYTDNVGDWFSVHWKRQPSVEINCIFNIYKTRQSKCKIKLYFLAIFSVDIENLRALSIAPIQSWANMNRRQRRKTCCLKIKWITHSSLFDNVTKEQQQ